MHKSTLSPPPKLLSEPRFLVAAHSPRQWPEDKGAEVAFAGRSNVGKSSAINIITQRKALARASRTPGRTQQIVFFELSSDRRLVDLPGYGYAKVPVKLRQHWGRMIEQYLLTRRALRGLILLMDARHPMTPLDRQMLDWCHSAQLAVHILLTKIDKLSRNQAIAAVKATQTVAESVNAAVQPFSTVNHEGIGEARVQILSWLGSNKGTEPNPPIK